MPHEHNDHIATVVSDVLEQMAFMFADIASASEMPTDVNETVGAEIHFTGSFNGALSLISTPQMCTELAANLLGTEADEIEIDECQDTIKELLNVICGQLLTTIAGNEPVFDLSPPKTVEGDQASWSGQVDDPSATLFMVEDDPVIVRLQLEQAA